MTPRPTKPPEDIVWLGNPGYSVTTFLKPIPLWLKFYNGVTGIMWSDRIPKRYWLIDAQLKRPYIHLYALYNPCITEVDVRLTLTVHYYCPTCNARNEMPIYLKHDYITSTPFMQVITHIEKTLFAKTSTCRECEQPIRVDQTDFSYLPTDASNTPWQVNTNKNSATNTDCNPAGDPGQETSVIKYLKLIHNKFYN